MMVPAAEQGRLLEEMGAILRSGACPVDMRMMDALVMTGGSENLSSSLVLNASAPLFKHLKVDEPAGAFLSLAVAAGFVVLVFRAHAKLV